MSGLLPDGIYTVRDALGWAVVHAAWEAERAALDWSEYCDDPNPSEILIESAMSRMFRYDDTMVRLDLHAARRKQRKIK